MSNSGLYGSTGNVTVSSNNVTTLYNSNPSRVVTGNVSDRNFTTLYTTQAEIEPTRSYSNLNVEEFLNTGFDSAGNQVENINMSGNLTVGGQSNLGNVGNVHIGGGTYNLVLSTDGNGNLSWIEQAAITNSGVLYIHFDVVATANNQTFTDSNISSYSNVLQMSVFKNGINIEPTQYSLSGNVVTIKIPLSTGDTIDILPSAGGGAAGQAGGNYYDVQFNGGGLLTGTDQFTFNPTTGNVKFPTGVANTIISNNVNTGNITSSNIVVTNITANGILNLGTVANIHIGGGTSGQYLQTDGTGNLSWHAANGSGIATSVIADVGNVIITGGTNGQVLSTNGSGNLSWTSNILFATNSNSANYANIANSSIVANSANFANSSNYANSANYANIANTAYLANNSNYSNIANTANTANVANVAAYASTANYANFAGSATTSNSSLTSNSANYANYANFAGSSTTSNSSLTSNSANYANYANFAGSSTSANTAITVTGNNQPNITSLGTLSNLNVTGNIDMQLGFELFTPNSTGSTGTVTFYVQTQSILYKTGNATANCTLNITGSSGNTLNSILPVNNSVTVVYINTVGLTPYIVNQLQIDGSNVSPKWVNGSSPTIGSRLSSAQQSYTFTIMKTATNTYNVLGSLVEFQ